MNGSKLSYGIIYSSFGSKKNSSKSMLITETGSHVEYNQADMQTLKIKVFQI